MNSASLLAVCCVGAALLVASNLWFLLRVLRPLQKLSLQAARLSQGELDSFDRQYGGISEIRALHRAMSGMVGHVRRAQEHSRAYAEQLADGQERERKRIARELHDAAVQSIIAITQGLDMAKNWVRTDADRAVHMLQLIREQAVTVVTDLRHLIEDLRPPALEELGLIPALKMQLGMIQQAEAKLSISGEPRRLDEAQELTLFRAAQEALRNIARHSQAAHIYIDVDYQPQGVRLQVRDDGCGFNPPPHLSDLATQRHYGLLGIHERVTNLGGRFRLDSQPGGGTTLAVYLPAAAHNQPADRARDPVCSALIEPQQAYGSVLYAGETYYFCCPVCQGAFQKDPAAYLDSADPAPVSPHEGDSP